MTTQYIGARYVPKFFENSEGNSEWVQNATYEPLTIVTYLGGTYTSKHVVVAGSENPADNKTDWAFMGLTSGEIASYIRKVEALEIEVANFEQTVNEKVNAVEASDANQNNLIANNTVIANRSASAFINQNEIKKKRFVLIGDSYASGTIALGDGNYTRNYEDGWMYKFISALNLSSDNVFVSPTGGNSFALQDSSVGHFQDSLQNIEVTNPQSIDYVIVMGGANDVYASRPDIIAGINDFCNIAKTRFPNACVMIGMCGNHYSGSMIAKMWNVLQAYNDGATNNKAIFIKGIENIAKHGNYIGKDSLHLTADGYSKLASSLVQFILSSNIDFNAYGNITFEPSYNGIIDNTPSIVSGTNNDISYLYWSDILISKGTDNFTVKANYEWNALGVTRGSDLLGRTDFPNLGIPFKATMIFRTPLNKFESYDCDCRIFGGGIYYRLIKWNDGHTGYASNFEANSIQFKSGIVTAPTYEQI